MPINDSANIEEEEIDYVIFKVSLHKKKAKIDEKDKKRYSNWKLENKLTMPSKEKEKLQQDK